MASRSVARMPNNSNPGADLSTPQMYFKLGREALEKGFPHQASMHFANVWNLGPAARSGELRLLMGIALCRRNEFGFSAVRMLLKGFRRSGYGNSNALESYAECLLHFGRYEQCVAIFRTVNESADLSPIAKERLCRYYEEAKTLWFERGQKVRVKYTRLLPNCDRKKSGAKSTSLQ